MTCANGESRPFSVCDVAADVPVLLVLLPVALLF
jgi:hypothetical protein